MPQTDFGFSIVDTSDMDQYQKSILKVRCGFVEDRRVVDDENQPPLTRFESQFDPLIPGYPGNIIGSGALLKIGRAYILEGPDPKNAQKSVVGFLENCFFNPNFSSNIMVVAGRPDQGRFGFVDYFTQSRQWSGYEVASSLKACSEVGMLKNYSLVVNNFQETKNIELFHFSEIPDFNTGCFSWHDMRYFYQIAQLMRDSHIGFHCAGGQGRAPSLALACFMYLNYDEIFIGNIDANLQLILTELRQSRIGAVQTEKQFIWARKLALNLKAMEIFFQNHDEDIESAIYRLGQSFVQDLYQEGYQEDLYSLIQSNRIFKGIFFDSFSHDPERVLALLVTVAGINSQSNHTDCLKKLCRSALKRFDKYNQAVNQQIEDSVLNLNQLYQWDLREKKSTNASHMRSDSPIRPSKYKKCRARPYSDPRNENDSGIKNSARQSGRILF